MYKDDYRYSQEAQLEIPRNSNDSQVMSRNNNEEETTLGLYISHCFSSHPFWTLIKLYLKT